MPPRREPAVYSQLGARALSLVRMRVLYFLILLRSERSPPRVVATTQRQHPSESGPTQGRQAGYVQDHRAEDAEVVSPHVLGGRVLPRPLEVRRIRLQLRERLWLQWPHRGWVPASRPGGFHDTLATPTRLLASDQSSLDSASLAARLVGSREYAATWSIQGG